MRVVGAVAALAEKQGVVAAARVVAAVEIRAVGKAAAVRAVER